MSEAPARKNVVCACAHRQRGAVRGCSALGMGDTESESEQIRLKCIRKDGFFTVPPEHRVRRETARGSSAVGRAEPERPGVA